MALCNKKIKRKIQFMKVAGSMRGDSRSTSTFATRIKATVFRNPIYTCKEELSAE